MTFCKHCGAHLTDDARFCPGCGMQVEAGAEGAQTGNNQGSPFGQQSASQSSFEDTVTEKFNQFTDTNDTTAEFDPTDIEKNKVMGILAYLSWLVLIPIFAAKDSKFARFHANQGLVLALTELIWWAVRLVVSNIIYQIIPFWFLCRLIMGVLNLVNLLFLVFIVLGIINVVTGKAKELPVIGRFKILS